MHTPPSINHPARQAERIATLDIVSGGRVEFGTGEGSSAAELNAFGIDADDKRGMWEEGLRVALRCMTRDAVHRLRRRTRRDAAAQRRAEADPAAASAGVGRVHATRDRSTSPRNTASARCRSRSSIPRKRKAWVDDYYTTLAAEGVPIGDAVNANLACVTGFMCHPDPAEAVRRGAEGSNFLGYSLGHYYVFGRHVPGATDIWADYQERRAGRGLRPRRGAPRQRRTRTCSAPRSWRPAPAGCAGAMGSPAQMRDYFQRYEDCGVDMLILSSAAGRNRHEHIMESYELIAREVLPEFIERDEKLRTREEPGVWSR